MKGVGYKGVGIASVGMLAAPLGNPPFDFDPNLVTFTPGMAKRATTVFATSPFCQGARDASGTPDQVSVTGANGTLILPTFYSNNDFSQGTITMRVTPEWAGNSGTRNYFYHCGAVTISRFVNNLLYLTINDQSLSIDISGWTAGTVYNLVFRWNYNNFVDGTNYACISVNDTHTFGITTKPTPIASATGVFIGYSPSVFPANAIIEGLTVYRRVLWDGAYGVNVGNGDEVALISAGIDPCTVTGSWDVVFCLPTNATTGAITTGTGNAWSHPHSSNVLTRGWLSDRYYGGGEWGVKYNGTSTGIDCGSGATLDNIPSGGVMQVEGWICTKASTGNHQAIMSKGLFNTSGWIFLSTTDPTISGGCALHVQTANGRISAYGPNTNINRWHHVVGSYNDATKIVRCAVDGIWGTASAAGSGAYVADAALSLTIGCGTTGGSMYWGDGSYGWMRIHNHEHYTPGTNFVPPRAYPGDDANTVEHWSLNDGSGNTAVATVTAPANNGTISNGTWEPQWHASGSPIINYGVIGSSSYRANVGSNASIDDLHDGAMTIEGWFRTPKVATAAVMNMKGAILSTGWQVNLTSSGNFFTRIMCATTPAAINTVARYDDDLWHHFAMTFDDAGDRKARLWIDGALIVTSNVGVGAIVSDAATDGFIGGLSAGNSGWIGEHGWVRWSNSVRYTVGFTPDPRSNPPATDANTMAQWNCTEGVGTTLADATGVNNGTISGTYSWGITPAMEVDSPGARVYGWGYVFGSDADDEGVEQTWVGLTAGANYVVRALTYSEDGVGQPKIIVYDETNGAVITTLVGTVASTEKAPDRMVFSFELPTTARYGSAADCTSITVRLLNEASTGVVGWDQIELLPNLLDNPSVEVGVGNPFIPTAWTNTGLDLNDTEQEVAGGTCHTGNCVQWNTGAVFLEGIYQTIASAAGKFYDMGCWTYGDSSAGFVMYMGGGFAQYSASINYITTPHTAAWSFTKAVFRSGGVAPYLQLYADDGATGNRFTDDFYILALDDVSLTVTPASAVNSVESGGIRVDGYDSGNQPIPPNRIFPTSGWVRFRLIPRHNIAIFPNFGFASPRVVTLWGDANNYIYIDLVAANTIRLAFNNGTGVVSGNWAAVGAIVAGINYIMEILWTPLEMRLIVDSTTRITIAGATGFALVPTNIYVGSNITPNYHVDAVFLAP